MAELALVRTPNGLLPATEADREQLSKWKVGQVVHGKYTQMRNSAFHRKFFAMLDLALDYWEPAGGLIPRQERRGIEGLARYFERLNGKPGQLQHAVKAYFDELERDRAERFPAVEKGREAFREWAIVEAGHFELEQTPTGIRKKAKSISFANMEQAKFDELYRDVFSVLWRTVLQSHFETEDDAMAAADLMGSFA